MLHELLIALSGHPGDVFQPFPPAPATATTFAVTDWPLLHPAEKESLDRLAQLGFYYSAFSSFVSKCLRPAFPARQTPRPGGMYLRALANALERKLQDYQQVIIQTEAAILSGEDNLGDVVPLPTITARFAPFQMLFPAISTLISEIEQAAMTESPFVGGKLIDLLQDKAASGVPIQKEWMSELLRSCSLVMMRQIISWVTYGQIQDPYDEFFILQLETEKPQSTGPRAGQTTRSQLRSRSAKSTTLPTATSSTPLPSTSIKWEEEFVVDENMLPTMIPSILAHAILFIGKSIITARQAKPKPIPIPQAMTEKHLNLILPLASDNPSSRTNDQNYISSRVLDVSKLTNIISQIRADIANHLWIVVQIGQKVVKTLESFRRYFLLYDGEFGLQLIDALEEFERNRLSRLGRFVTPTAPTVSIRDHDLGGILTKAAQGTRAQDDPLLRRFELRLLRPPKRTHGDTESDEKQRTQGMFDDQLLGIPVRLWFMLAWPLDFFLATEDLGYYGDVFAYLITIRRAQKRLQQSWLEVKSMTQQMYSRRRTTRGSYREYVRRKKSMDNETENDEQEEEILKHVAAMRSDMYFVVNCLWTYLQMDVISPIYDKLLQNIMKCEGVKGNSDVPMSDSSSVTNRSFDLIHSLHAEALHEMRRACLLTSEALSLRIKDLLASAVAFCGILGRRAAGQDGFHAGSGEEQDKSMWQDWTDLSHQHQMFRGYTAKLFEGLSAVSRSGSLDEGPVLRKSVSGLSSSVIGNSVSSFEAIRQVDQLLLRLEYSKHIWTVNGEQDDEDGDEDGMIDEAGASND